MAGELEVARPTHDMHLVAIALGKGDRRPYWPTAKPYQPTFARLGISCHRSKRRCLASMATMTVAAPLRGLCRACLDGGRRRAKETARSAWFL